MAIIVEDGAGVTDANSYASVAAADSYHLDRGNTAWVTANNAAKEAALIRATDYIDIGYTFWSYPLSNTQSLAFPRINFVMPQKLVQATIALALEALSAPLNPSQDSRVVTSAREKLEGVGETEYQYGSFKQTRFPNVDNMLSGIVSGKVGTGSGTIQANRI